MAKTIAITGISGYFGTMLLPLLVDDPGIENIIGIDHNLTSHDQSTKKIQYHHFDINNPRIEHLITDVDILVHLAFDLMRQPGTSQEMAEKINLNGARTIFDSATRQGVSKIIFTSSVVAYGIHPDNPDPLTEESPLRPNLYYGKAKVAVEQYLDSLQDENPDLIITKLRPCTVVGPHAAPRQMASLTSIPAALVKGFDPPYQLLHEDDIAQALYLAIKKDIPGIFNVTSDDPLTLSRLALSQPGGRVISLPYGLARILAWFSWITRSSDFAPEWLDLARYPIIASNLKLKQQGWQPKFTTAEAYANLINAKQNDDA